MAHVLLLWVSVNQEDPEGVHDNRTGHHYLGAKTSILRTRFSSPAGIADVVSWRAGLSAAAAIMPRGASFKLLVDIRGYDVAKTNPTVHKVQREVVPIFLVAHSFRTGFIEFFGVKEDFVSSRKDAFCQAVAHLHHEEAKMNLYRQTLGRKVENFFSDLPEAETWLAELPWQEDEPWNGYKSPDRPDRSPKMTGCNSRLLPRAPAKFPAPVLALFAFLALAPVLPLVWRSRLRSGPAQERRFHLPDLALGPEPAHPAGHPIHR